MGKYDKYKKIVLSANLIKQMITTSIPGSYGHMTTAGPGNEGVDLAEWINERIDDGTISSPSSPSATNLSFIRDATTVTVESDTGTDAILPAATSTLAGVMTGSDKTNLSSLIVLSGVPAATSNLGTFTGTIIPDSSSIKQALQALETELDSIPSITSGDLTSVNTAITITNGAASVLNSGVALTFNPANVNLDDLGGSLNLSQLNTTGATTGDFLIFNGTNFESTSYTPPISDHNDLTLIQGGTTNEYYHLSNSLYTKLTNATANVVLGKVSTPGEIQELTLTKTVTFNSNNIELVNDQLSPGNDKFYGTNASGVKGWYNTVFTGVTSVSVTDSSDIDFTITNPTTTPNITGVLTTSGVVAGTYGSSSAVPVYTVDSKGRLTAAGNTTISISSTSVVDFNESVDDRINSLLVAGTNINFVYDDSLNTLTINSIGAVTGTGTDNYVAFWDSTSNLVGDIDLQFDGIYFTVGNPTNTFGSRISTKGFGAGFSTYGYVHYNSADTAVFKVVDNGGLALGPLETVFIHPDFTNISYGGTYTIQKAGGDLALYSDTTVIVESGDTATNTPSLKSVATRSTSVGNVLNAQIQGTFNMASGSNRYTDLYINTSVNQSGGTSPVRSIYIEPTITAATNYAGIEINAPSHTALRTTAGKVRFDLGSDATGDILYRDANGNLARLPIGGPTEVLGSTGTIPAWTTTAGSLPGGSAKAFLVYSGGSWVAGVHTTEKQTGLTGTNITLASAPLVDTPVQIYKNGLLQDDPDDYSVSGSTVTMTTALVTLDKITAIYYI